MDTTDTSKAGTGDKIGEIELDDETYVIYDDGDSDHYVTVDSDNAPIESDVAALARSIRSVFGDEVAMAMLDRPGQDGSSGRDVTPGWRPRSSPAFKCEECNKTWARSKNDGNDRCPDCSDV